MTEESVPDLEPDRRAEAGEPTAAGEPAAGEPAAGDDAATESGRLGRVGGLLEDAVGAVVGGASSVVGGAVDLAQGAARRWDERPASRVRQVRRRARRPLPYLYDVHPEARKASPRELGLKTVDAEDIVGTAVGGAVQRAGDFLPRKAFRSMNWNARWQRLRQAADRLAILPPVDLLLFRGRYWVLDGHNRVALALYGGQVSLDANVIELVPPGERPSEQASSLAPVLEGSLALRTAGEGHRPGSFDDDHVHERREDGE